MKRSRSCPKCQSRRVGHLESLPDTVGKETQISTQALGLVVGLEGPTKVGQIEAYVCADCGYLEAYVREPAQVPFDQIVGFSWVGAQEKHPYR